MSDPSFLNPEGDDLSPDRVGLDPDGLDPANRPRVELDENAIRERAENDDLDEESNSLL